MAEPQDPRPPRLSFSPGGYLPRLWRAEPEPAPEADPAPGEKKKGAAKRRTGKDKGKGKKARSGDPEGDEKKGVLLEETPGLDTVEARRTARIIAGVVASLSLLLVAFLFVRIFFASEADEQQPVDEKEVMVDLRSQRERSETEARTMIERARELDRNGKTDLALSLLNRLSTSYPETKAAADARDAISRPNRNLPLFPEVAKGATRAATGSTGKATPDPNGTRTSSSTEGRATIAANPPTSPVPVHPNPEADLVATSIKPAPPPIAAVPGPGPGPASTPRIRPLPGGYQVRSGVDIDRSGWPREIVAGRDGSVMVLVPGGTFLMGRDGGDPSEAPAHQVKVSTFYVDKHEVTNRQFDQFVKETGPRAERNRALAREGEDVILSEDYPAVMVSARDAKDYADWVGKWMPTEAQWEFAARGTDHRAYPWGPLPPVWEKPREPRQIDAVMSFPSDLSPYGAYDMGGNALEWTRDWFDSNYYANFRGVLAEDPTGPASRPASSELTIKGGSIEWVVSAREGLKFDSRLPSLGFRCVLPVEGPDNAFQPARPSSPAQNAPGRSGKGAVVPF